MQGLIYLIRNIITGVGYVGQTRKRLPEMRWTGHKCDFRHGRGNPRLRNSFLLHGEGAFTVETLERVEAPSASELRVCLATQEDYWMARLRSEGMELYNAASAVESMAWKPQVKPNTTSWNKGMSLTPEHRQNISARKAGEPSPKKGKHQSEAQRKNLSAALKGNTRRKGTSTSEEGRANISASKKGKPSPKRGTVMPLEQREKLSDAHRGKPLTEEHRAAQRAAAKGRTWTLVEGVRVYSKLQSKEP